MVPKAHGADPDTQNNLFSPSTIILNAFEAFKAFSCSSVTFSFWLNGQIYLHCLRFAKSSSKHKKK